MSRTLRRVHSFVGTWIPLVLVFLAIPACRLSSVSIVAGEKPEDSSSGSSCGMYMAESSIPNAGWGMYNGDRIIRKNEAVHPLDVVVQVADYWRNMRERNRFHEELPKWLLQQYYWLSFTTGALYDARKIASIVPGLGMLANSHPGLVNVEIQGPMYREQVDRASPEAGAYSEYKNHTYRARRKIQPGQEFMVRYGDDWFSEREDVFGTDFPLSQDFKTADRILDTTTRLCRASSNPEFCKDLWQLVRFDMDSAIDDRVLRALPDRLEDVEPVARKGTARHSVPNLIRSMEWLEENGMCLDNIEPSNSTIPHAGMGAFATRFLANGSLVAPAPVVHMHIGHMDILLTDSMDSRELLWQGQQLLLNYLYGHPSSSLVFFPYSPVVNLINHSPTPNVKLQWSSKLSHPEWLNLTTDEVVQENDKTGLMMEIVALRDIQPGEEVVLDYGPKWQEAWRKHVESWEAPWTASVYNSPDYVDSYYTLPTERELKNKKGVPLPVNVMTICWLGEELEERRQNKKKIYTWSDEFDVSDVEMDESTPCALVSRRREKGDDFYTVRAKFKKKPVVVEGVPREAIRVVNKAYAGNQFLRESFRHPIHLPDEMIPANWRDLDHPDPPTCQLFMAESSIPNSGLGMYTAKELKAEHPIFYPDVVIQAEDVELNRRLRRWHHNIPSHVEPRWLLEHYWWQPQCTGAEYEAMDIQSIVPGIGMLANSHTSLYNALESLPFRDSSGLRRQEDPGAGASSTYHGMKYVASADIEAGSEIFAKYGDDWFEERTDLGAIPLEDDFVAADEALLQFWEVIGGDVESALAKELWEVMWNTTYKTADNRIGAALPKRLEDVEEVLDIGTAKFSLPGRIKSIEWLEENGICLDNIRAAPSSIPQAGYGAFATRFVGKGHIIAPAPVVHLHRRHMEVYDSRDVDDPDAATWYEREQLLLNYCYGHANSTVLFFPYSPVVNYINHDLTNFNAELRWSSLPSHQSDWLQLSVEDLMLRNMAAGLIMEIVATRDINPGEEILLNYGDEWDAAWKKHVQEWKPDPRTADYYPAHALNDFTKLVAIDNNDKGDGVMSYPENIVTACYMNEISEDTQADQTEEAGLIYRWEFFDDIYEKTDTAYPCQVLDVQHGDLALLDSIRGEGETYTARIKQNDFEFLVSGIPRRAIQFFDDEYKSDQFLNSAFRHPIGLPDDMLPPAWNDRDPNSCDTK